VLFLGQWAIACHATAQVRVYGQAQSTGPILNVQVFADIAEPPLVSCGFRLLYDSTVLQLAKAAKNEEAWFFYDGKSRLAYLDPQEVAPGQLLVLGAKLDLRTPLDGVAGQQVLLGTFQFQRLTSAVPKFGLAIGRESSFANFVTIEGTVLDRLKGMLEFGDVLPDANDVDLDGLLDKWEVQYFGDIRNAYYSDDPDKDGFDNLEEQAMGTNPTVPNTGSFGLTVTRQGDTIRIEWPGTEGRTYTVETSLMIPGDWKPFVAGLVATPPTNQYEFTLSKFGPALFMRVVLEPQR